MTPLRWIVATIILHMLSMHALGQSYATEFSGPNLRVPPEPDWRSPSTISPSHSSPFGSATQMDAGYQGANRSELDRFGFEQTHQVAQIELGPGPIPLGQVAMPETQVVDVPGQEFHYSLIDLESLATQNHPALLEARARIDAARGRSVQAGLGPNPTVGYIGNEMGNDGSPGQHGAFVSRKWVRGGKLQLSRSVECRDVDRLTHEYQVTQQRILTDVRMVYTSLYWLQQRLESLQRFREVNNVTLGIAERRREAEENTKRELLFAQIRVEETSTELITVEAAIEAKWRELNSVLGNFRLEPGQLSAEGIAVPDLTWDEALARMQQSPQITAAESVVSRAEMALRRARVEPIPNLNTQFSLQYDFATDDTFAGVQVGVPVPKRNRNQGGIAEATANVHVAARGVERLRLSLERQLAEKYGAYRTAKLRVSQIAEQIVPKAEEVVRIAQRAYQADQTDLVQVLLAQQSMLRSTLNLQEAKQQLQAKYVEIQGFLLTDSLAGP